MSELTPFHLAVQVRDIAEARAFYGEKLGFEEGRSSAQWIDFNMFGHQFVVHLNSQLSKEGKVPHISNQVDGKGVPVPHFGVVMEMTQWRLFADRLASVIDSFVIEPYIRFEGQPGEQGTLFFLDPSGNALEFKGFSNIQQDVFKTD
ncbi:VOC family protein [Thalassotalea aquiviva]|uniref:VOC family protein n=1 Tax=Thalassotalea aquiviva TaxID=3242415 RepID=UPI00352B4546